MIMVTKNGYGTYSKTAFKEGKHPRSAGGSFAKKAKTEEDDVSYHYKFNPKGHHRKADGSFSNSNVLSEACQTGYARYGSKS